jgi:hypothetical protein
MSPRKGGKGKLVRQALEFLREAKRRERRGGRGSRMPAERLRHTLMGERDGRTSGFHHRPGGVDPPGAKLLRVTRRHPHTGVYEGRVALLNRRTGQWREKRGVSTFFPDHWSREQVDNAVDRGFREGAVKDAETGRWRSTFRGVDLEGFYDPDTDTLLHGYPVLPRGGTP